MRRIEKSKALTKRLTLFSEKTLVYYQSYVPETFSLPFRTKAYLEKKLAQATAKLDEEKASLKKHHSTIAKVCC